MCVYYVYFKVVNLLLFNDNGYFFWFFYFDDKNNFCFLFLWKLKIIGGCFGNKNVCLRWVVILLFGKFNVFVLLCKKIIVCLILRLN